MTQVTILNKEMKLILSDVVKDKAKLLNVTESDIKELIEKNINSIEVNMNEDILLMSNPSIIFYVSSLLDEVCVTNLFSQNQIY